MIYTIIMRKSEFGGDANISIGGPFRIKVPKLALDDQPYIGFSSLELGEAYLRIKNFPSDNFHIEPIESLLDEEQRKKLILIFENEKQIHDVEKNGEVYDYESLIHRNAL